MNPLQQLQETLKAASAPIREADSTNVAPLVQEFCAYLDSLPNEEGLTFTAKATPTHINDQADDGDMVHEYENPYTTNGDKLVFPNGYQTAVPDAGPEEVLPPGEYTLDALKQHFKVIMPHAPE